MIELSKKIFYAVEAVLYIAYNGGNECISSKEIAEKQQMLPRYLEQIMQKLVRAGILKGLRGPSGGYLLAREKRRITLYDICLALGEGETELHANVPSSTALGNQIIRPLVKELYTPFFERLRVITLADLHLLASNRGIKKTSEEYNDFAI